MAYSKPKGRSEASGSLIQFPDAHLFKPQNKQKRDVQTHQCVQVQPQGTILKTNIVY